MEQGISLSALEEEVLTLLAHKEAYGMQIIDSIAELSNGCRSSTQGTYYPIFKRLQVKELICSDWGDSLLGARRKYYRITDLGNAALKAKQVYRLRLAQWSNLCDPQLLEN